MRRVVITGVGVVAPNGVGKDAFWQGCVDGHSGIGPIRSFDASNHPCQNASLPTPLGATTPTPVITTRRMTVPLSAALASSVRGAGTSRFPVARRGVRPRPCGDSLLIGNLRADALPKLPRFSTPSISTPFG